MKKKGRGISSIGYCTGFYGGGDPNQAEVKLNMDGSFELLIGTTDLGQGAKTSFMQVAAEVLDVPIESFTVENSDTDFAPFCMGAFASRAMFIGGNAVIAAATDLKEKIKAYAAPMLESTPDKVEMADNKVFVKDNPEKSLGMGDIGGASTFGGGYLVGSGFYRPDGPYQMDAETGEMSSLAAAAFACAIVDVEVDTETGVVEVKNAVHAYELGKAISPLICKGQINGGTAMGIGMALTESAHPYWPSIDHAVDSFGDYVIATAADMPPEDTFAMVEVPHPDGPYGAKGFCEMSANAQIPAIASAIHDAIGVWITEWPIPPESVLRALAAKES